MEPNFICDFPLTGKMETNRIRENNAARCAILMAITSVSFAIIMCCAILCILIEGFSIYWIFMMLFACCLLIYGVFWPNLAAKSMIYRYRKEYGTDRYRISFGEGIEVQAGSIRIVWNYEDITSVVHWKYTYELQRSRTLAVRVCPECFVKGNFEEFKAFLRKKRPDLTIPE